MCRKTSENLKHFDALLVHFCLEIHNLPILCLLIMQFFADEISINGLDFECQNIFAQKIKLILDTGKVRHFFYHRRQKCEKCSC